MNSTYRPNTETLEPFKAKRADRAGFCQPAIHLGLELDASGLAPVAEETGNKKLFCRLPRPLQVALQAHVTCREPSPDG
jgi:hypothetical protein